MCECIDLSGKVEYQVNYVRDGSWKVLGGTHKPARYKDRIDAEHSVQMVRGFENVGDVLVIRVETVFFSDMETREVFKAINYVGER